MAFFRRRQEPHTSSPGMHKHTIGRKHGFCHPRLRARSSGSTAGARVPGEGVRGVRGIERVFGLRPRRPIAGNEKAKHSSGTGTGHETIVEGKEALPEDGVLLQETAGRWRYQRMALFKHAEGNRLTCWRPTHDAIAGRGRSAGFVLRRCGGPPRIGNLSSPSRLPRLPRNKTPPTPRLPKRPPKLQSQ